MSCDNPRAAYEIEGGIQFYSRNHVFNKLTPVIKIPCRACTGCRLDHRSMWSIRLMNEAQMHEHNQFVTFTYSDDNLPKNNNLDQRDMQLMFKRLRRKINTTKLRYTYSGEYGGITSRPHFHAIIFDLQVPDLEILTKNSRGEPLYSSEFLDKIWQKGHTTTGKVTPQSCAYVAGYMLKDSDGSYDKRDTYKTIDCSTGEETERNRPFARYSNRPAIGKTWFDKYHSDLFPGDQMILTGGKKAAVPKYYLNQLEKLNPKMHAEIKAKRQLKIEDPYIQWNNTPERKAVRAIVRNAKMNLSNRGSKSEQINHTFLVNQDG